MVLKILTVLAVLIVGTAGITIVIRMCRPSPNEALRLFLTSDHLREEDLTKPLNSAGRNVIPVVIEAIRDHEMPRRRYAIGFLADRKAIEAVPVLLDILADSEEKDYFRGDALQAIFRIDPKRASQLSRAYLDQPGTLGTVARRIAEE
jgi:hypothetical protein